MSPFNVNFCYSTFEGMFKFFFTYILYHYFNQNFEPFAIFSLRTNCEVFNLI